MAAQEGMQRGAVCLSTYAGLIRKVAFPHEIAVYAAVAATLVLQFVGYLAVLGVLTIFGETVRFEGLIIAIPLWIVMAIAVTGLALFFAALQVFIRDVEHMLMPALMMLMFLTPILYPMERVPADLRVWVGANPFAWLVERMRAALLDGNLALEWGDALALVVAIATFAGGRWIFRRLSPHFEDFL
jgi:ABC-type polysaccharide/polyol phosphate export permease